MLAKLTLVAVCMLIGACTQRPQVSITISNTPESIESCGPKIGGC